MIHVRGFENQVVEFRYPVTALIGTNGGGKSTILGAAAISSKNILPGKFFPKASVGDDTMADWRIEFDLVDKSIAAEGTIQRTARFSQRRWRRDEFPPRNVEYIEIQRTVPAGELGKFKRFLGNNPENIEFSPISEETARYATAILGRDVSSYRLATLPGAPTNSMYICVKNEGGYSQFHFGAGEASIITTVDRIESAPNNSLILIEEIENGLHPVATKLLTEYLMNVSRRKRHQVLFTTHSQVAVDVLPPEAVWACINSRTFNGHLTVESLRAVVGQIPDKLAIFVEDDFVIDWLKDAIGRFSPDIVETTNIYRGGGYPNVLNVARYHNENPSIELPALCLIDGDVNDGVTNIELPDYARFIPGGTPESVVYSYIHENSERLSAIIRQRALLTAFSQDRIVEEITSVHNAALDPHVLFERLAERFNFHSELTLRKAFINIFNEENEKFWEETISFLRRMHPDANAT